MQKLQRKNWWGRGGGGGGGYVLAFWFLLRSKKACLLEIFKKCFQIIWSKHQKSFQMLFCFVKMCTNIPWIAATNIGNAVGTKSNDHFFIISTNTRKPVEKFILFCKSESKTRFLLTKLLPNCRFFIRYWKSKNKGLIRLSDYMLPSFHPSRHTTSFQRL